MAETRKAKDYDSTIMRIAGNLLSGAFNVADYSTIGRNREYLDVHVVKGAVVVARAIVAEVLRSPDEE